MSLMFSRRHKTPQPMAKNNFDYSIDIVNKMRKILLPDMVSLIKRKIEKEKKLDVHDYSKRRQLMTLMLINMLSKKIFVDEFAINSKPWVIVIYTVNNKLIVTLRELEHDSVFRYNIDEFDNDQFNVIINYIDVMTDNESEYIKNKPTLEKSVKDE